MKLLISDLVFIAIASLLLIVASEAGFFLWLINLAFVLYYASYVTGRVVENSHYRNRLSDTQKGNFPKWITSIKSDFYFIAVVCAILLFSIWFEYRSVLRKIELPLILTCYFIGRKVQGEYLKKATQRTSL